MHVATRLLLEPRTDCSDAISATALQSRAESPVKNSDGSNGFIVVFLLFPLGRFLFLSFRWFSFFIFVAQKNKNKPKTPRHNWKIVSAKKKQPAERERGERRETTKPAIVKVKGLERVFCFLAARSSIPGQFYRSRTFSSSSPLTHESLRPLDHRLFGGKNAFPPPMTRRKLSPVRFISVSFHRAGEECARSLRQHTSPRSASGPGLRSLLARNQQPNGSVYMLISRKPVSWFLFDFEAKTSGRTEPSSRGEEKATTTKPDLMAVSLFSSPPSSRLQVV